MHGEAGILLWTVCYFFVVLVLSAYGIHRYLIIHLYFKNRHRKPAIPARFDNLPVVTVQLPVYNEIHVIERLLKAIGEIEYPIEKLEIQVLDDSTDETYQLSQREAAKLRARGFDAVVLRRENRVGFKAGALDYGFRGGYPIQMALEEVGRIVKVLAAVAEHPNAFERHHPVSIVKSGLGTESDNLCIA